LGLRIETLRANPDRPNRFHLVRSDGSEGAVSTLWISVGSSRVCAIRTPSQSTQLLSCVGSYLRPHSVRADTETLQFLARGHSNPTELERIFENTGDTHDSERNETSDEEVYLTNHQPCRESSKVAGCKRNRQSTSPERHIRRLELSCGLPCQVHR